MSQPTLTIPKDVIEPIIQAHVSTAIIEAFGGTKQILSEAIRRVLAAKVDNAGAPSNYGNEEFIQWAARAAIEKAIKATMAEELTKYQDQLRAAIVKSLKDKNSPFIKMLADAMVKGVSDSETLKYRLSVEIVTPR